MKSLHLLHHVKAHQDDYKKRSDLPLEAQLNCHCDDLTKAGVTDRIINGVEEHQKLPLKLACVFINKNKQTIVLAKGLRHFIGKEQTKESCMD